MHACENSVTKLYLQFSQEKKKGIIVFRSGEETYPCLMFQQII